MKRAMRLKTAADQYDTTPELLREEWRDGNLALRWMREEGGALVVDSEEMARWWDARKPAIPQHRSASQPKGASHGGIDRGRTVRAAADRKPGDRVGVHETR